MNTFIERSIKARLTAKLLPNKVVLLAGARRVGKTVFVNHLLAHVIREQYLLLNGEDMATHAVLENRTIENYRRLMGDRRFLVIDEAQKVPDIGQVLKLMVDNIEGIRILATGSSALDLSNKMGEPLTGRKFTFNLYPLAQMEFTGTENFVETRARLEERMIFGSYPELLQYSGNYEKAEYLRELVNAYLFKDILALEDIRNSDKIAGLLRLVAFQIGKEVSLEELGRQLGLSRNTVEKYLDLLSKVFVVFRLPGFSRNLRNEITKTSRWYFYDNGVRNTLINNMNPIAMRNDAGELWENYLVSERIKFQHYTGMSVNNYFWRTYQQHEIDLVEEAGGSLAAYELKWSPTKNAKPPLMWSKAYPESSFKLINPENYLDWIT